MMHRRVSFCRAGRRKKVAVQQNYFSRAVPLLASFFLSASLARARPTFRLQLVLNFRPARAFSRFFAPLTSFGAMSVKRRACAQKNKTRDATRN